MECTPCVGGNRTKCGTALPSAIGEGPAKELTAEKPAGENLDNHTREITWRSRGTEGGRRAGKALRG